MESQTKKLGKGLRILQKPNSRSVEGINLSPNSLKLRRFLQLQIDQLAAQPQIQWIEVIYRDPQVQDFQRLEISQKQFPYSKKFLGQLRAKLERIEAPVTLNPVVSGRLGAGFYHCYLNQQNCSDQYLLLFSKEPLSHTCRQLVRRTVIGMTEYLKDHQRSLQKEQQIQLLEGIVQRVAHQLRHPLSLISLYAHNLIHNLPQGAEQEQSVVISQTAQHLNKSLTEIIECSNNEELQVSLHDLRSLVLEVLSEARGWIEEKNLKVCCSDHPVFLELDALQFKQALSNLLSNAIHFSPPDTSIVMDWKEQQGNVLLTVSDEGKGLSPEDLKQLFKPFYTCRDGGTGLGLAIVQKVVRAHGGKLWAKNSARRGAEFSMSLPRQSVNLAEDIAC